MMKVNIEQVFIRYPSIERVSENTQLFTSYGSNQWTLVLKTGLHWNIKITVCNIWLD